MALGGTLILGKIPTLGLLYTHPHNFLIFPAAAMLLQTAAPVIGDFAGPVERIGLLTALMIAVKVLYTSNSAKDKIILDMAGQMIKVTTEVLGAVKELRSTTDQMRLTTDELGNAMDNLASNIAAIPCAVAFSEHRESPKGHASEKSKG